RANWPRAAMEFGSKLLDRKIMEILAIMFMMLLGAFAWLLPEVDRITYINNLTGYRTAVEIVMLIIICGGYNFYKQMTLNFGHEVCRKYKRISDLEDKLLNVNKVFEAIEPNQITASKDQAEEEH